MATLYRVTGRDFGEPANHLFDSYRNLAIGATFSATLDPAVEAVLVSAGLLGFADPGKTGLNEVGELVDWAVNHGRKFIQLDERPYDNSVATLAIPAGFRVEGGSHDTTSIDLPLTGDPLTMDQYSKLGHCFLNIKGAVAGPALGTSPAPNGTGIVMQPKAHIYGCFLQRFHAAFWLMGDHIAIDDCETFECAFGLYRPGGGSRGNLFLQRNRFTGCIFGAFGVGVGTEEDSLESYSNHYGFSPYGWFGFPGAGQHEYAFTNVTSVNDSFESCGNRHIDLGARKISGDMYNPKTGALDSTYTLAAATGTFSGLYTTGGNRNYVFESGNGDAASLGATGTSRTSSDGKFTIHGSGGDTSQGPFLAAGSTGVFHTN